MLSLSLPLSVRYHSGLNVLLHNNSPTPLFTGVFRFQPPSLAQRQKHTLWHHWSAKLVGVRAELGKAFSRSIREDRTLLPCHSWSENDNIYFFKTLHTIHKIHSYFLYIRFLSLRLKVIAADKNTNPGARAVINGFIYTGRRQQREEVYFGTRVMNISKHPSKAVFSCVWNRPCWNVSHS